MAKKQSGGDYLKASKRQLIWVAPDEEQKEQIRVAAAIKGIPMSQFLLECGLRESEKIVEKYRSSS
jgi:uncharacterized protein (DUF1778 family)